MKKKLIAGIFALAFTYVASLSGLKTMSAAAAMHVPAVTAQTAIVADAVNGRVVCQKDMHKKMYPASITKIMTGLLAVEKGRDTDSIIVTPEVRKNLISGAQNIDLKDGERITQQEALYTMFLRSANDSANALAIHIGGTMQNFVGMMNARAKVLGCTDTHFANANGLPDKDNVTSAYDMAIITKKAVEEPKLMEYFGATAYAMPATNKRKATTYTTLHKMMRNTVYKYSGVIAGKTGWETMSGHTLVTVARRDGRTLICVVMKSSSGYSIYSDTIALLNYGFSLPDAASSEYLKTPQTAAIKPIRVSKPTTAEDTAVTKPVKKEETENTATGGSMVAPLLLLACSICIFAFLTTCRSVKQPKRRVRRRPIE